MRITVESLSKRGYEKRDYKDMMWITMDDELVFSVKDGEPEDNNLSRNFADCWSVPKLLKFAYDAGKNEQKFELCTFEKDEF